MNTTESIQTTKSNDSELVGKCLVGDRDAFRQIVERYQTLISSLAYCATGNVSQSEDLAQETFVSAWKHLSELREPAKLRPWLCSITRFLISKEFRRQGREPIHAAEPLEAVDEWTAPEPMPVDHVISDEEKAILWRSLERIPEIYREPLVLFYREHQSVEAVAKDLGLSEEVVRQRLSRGRKVLQEQFLSFVAGALKQTSPGKVFTMGVIAALPLLATTAKAATASATAAKSGAIAKATGLGAIFQAILKGITSFLGVLSPVLLLGGYFGFKMGGDARQSPQQRESVARFWRITVGCLVAFVAAPILMFIFLMLIHGGDSGGFKQTLLHGMTIWLGLLYVVVPVALMVWAWQRRQKRVTQTAVEPATVMGKKRGLVLWVIVAMTGAACILGFGLLDTNWKVQHISTKEAQKVLTDEKGKQAQFFVLQYQNGYSYLWIVSQENGRKIKRFAPLDDATLAMIKAQGIKCPTYVQGRDFEVFGWPGRLLPLLCVFILAIGGAVLLRRPGKRTPEKMDAEQTRKLQRVERAANKLFGSGMALVLIVGAILVGLITPWRVQSIAVADARQIVGTSTNLHCEVIQYKNGNKELFINVQGNRSYRQYVTTADDGTLALLAKQGVTCRTIIQGRDFGFACPTKSVSAVCILILIASAFALLRVVIRKNGALTAPAASGV